MQNRGFALQTLVHGDLIRIKTIFTAGLWRVNQIIYLQEVESLNIVAFMLVFSRKDEYLHQVKHAARLMQEGFVSHLYKIKPLKCLIKGSVYFCVVFIFQY